ncbi:1-phosphofructokinase [Agathobaculum sp. Marseille-P7918]|uniref:1-phosphofructokinase n=1 Tax=Agathobaculum sp. Marseille-P7918 TaxID=2479843 RepID=UPI00356143DD
MIYTVTLNPSLDYLVCTDALRPGKLCRTNGETLHPGGKGVNVSLVCAALGLPTRALGFIAGRTGALFASLLAETGVEYDFCHLDEGMTRINVKVCAGEQTELNGAGPQITAEALARLAETLDTLGEDDWLVLSGSVPAGVPADIYARLLERVHKNGVRTVLDTSGDALKNALPCAPDLIKPNQDELDALVGGAPHNPAGIAACARELQAAGAKDILISCGAQGAVLVPVEGQALYLEATPGDEVVQPVGSGDSMTAGWLYAHTNGLSAAETLRYAVATGSAAAFSAWLPDRAKIEATLAKTGMPRSI